MSDFKEAGMDVDRDSVKSSVTWTYFIQSGVDGPIKIGKAENPENRLAELQTGSPDSLRLIGKLKGDHEKDLHCRFHKLHFRGEWFNPDVRLLAFILDHAESCGEIEGLVDAARHLVRTFDKMKDEVMEMWFAIASTQQITGQCKWPHLNAFDEGIDVLRKRVASCSRSVQSHR